MTNTKNSNPAPLAHRIPSEVSPVITAYAEWLTAETGYKVDPMSVYLGSQLRGTFQKGEANQKRIAEAAAARIKRETERAKAKAEREAAAAKRAAEPKTTKPAPATKAPARRTSKAAPAVATVAEAVQA